MLDISAIKNEERKTLILASKKFRTLTKEQQADHIKKIAALSPEKQKEIAAFLTNENAKEQQEDAEKVKILKGLYDQVVALEENFQKLLKSDPEKKSREGDEKTINNLLQEAQKA